MIGRRIKELRKETGLSQAALALRLGLTQQAIGKWETGRSAPDYHMLVKIAKALGVRADVFFDRSYRRPGYADVLGEPTLPYGSVMVPMLGPVKAGYGLEAQEEHGEYEPAQVKDASRYFYLEVTGDSMEPRIRDKDLALVRKQATLEDGDLGVFIYGDGEGTIKRFYRKGDTVALQAFNPAYETLILSGDDLERLRIIGKVVETKTRW